MIAAFVALPPRLCLAPLRLPLESLPVSRIPDFP